MDPIAAPHDPLPWSRIASPIAAAEDALARLDERLAKSPIQTGFIARAQFSDAAAALWLEGELISLEDLVLHDCDMDIRAPTHPLVRAHAILRARRRIAAADPDWALSPAGLAALRDGAGASSPGDSGPATDDADAAQAPSRSAASGDEDEFANALARVDAAILSAEKTLASRTSAPDAPRAARAPIYDPDHDEEARLAAWRARLSETRALPPTLAAALTLDAWNALQPLEHRPWLGALLAAALLRARGKTRHHLPCLATGLKAIARSRRRASDPSERLVALLAAIEAAATAGLADHDRWMTARAALLRKIAGRRAHSNLPALVDYVISRPLVSAAMIAQELQISQRAAQNLVIDLGLREATGRTRYRAWGVL